MSWVRIDDEFPDHRKIAGLTNDAFCLHVTAMCWVAKQQTDGKLPSVVLRRLAWRCQDPAMAAAELETAGVWDKTPEGWEIHDFLTYNPTKEQIIELAAKRSEAGKAGAMARWQDHGKEDGKPHGKEDGKIMPPSPFPSPLPLSPSPDPNPKGAATPRAAAAPPSSAPPSKRLRKEKPETPEQVTWFRSVTGRFPPKELFPKVIEIVDGRRDADMLTACWSEWIGRGYNRVNYGWFLDWYKKGKIPPGRNGNGNDLDAQNEAHRRRMRALLGDDDGN